MNVVSSLIDLADFFLFFFQEKCVHAQFWFFAAWLVISFKFCSFPMIKGRQVSLSNSKIVKVTKNDFQFRKWKLVIRFPGEIKILPIDPVFSNWVKFKKKVSIIIYSTNLKSFKAIYFFSPKFKSWSFLKKKQGSFFFQFLCIHILIQLSVGYVFHNRLMIWFIRIVNFLDFSSGLVSWFCIVCKEI